MDRIHPSTVDVVMPCYNAMPYLPRALDSVLAQTHAPNQVIVVDDGSTDGSADCVQRYINEHPTRGLRLVRQQNQKEPAARNAGIRLATAYWVAMFDADDWWEPNKLTAQLDAAERAGPDCVLVHTGQTNEYADGRSEPYDNAMLASRVGWCTRTLLTPGAISHPSILVRRDALEEVGPYDVDFPHACDVELYFRLSTAGTFAFVPDRLMHYRIHQRQTSFNYKLDQVRYHHRVVTEFFAKRPELEAQVGRPFIDAQLARLVEVKLESLYWQRRLPEFRSLLAFAREKRVDSATIARWRSRSRVPDWLIRLKDRLGGAAPTSAAGGAP